ncbi:erythromycin esterase family protein [Embleya sp. NPDC050154]|uniref:erythromycin esterase family protein n=1 Tax=Embleya sp. NPDC050154 TaxID=3363988 RepID=UPI0037909892
MGSHFLHSSGDTDIPVATRRCGPRSGRLSRILLPVLPLLCLAATVAGTPAQAAPASSAVSADSSSSQEGPARALARTAHPLGSTVPGGSDADLRAFDTMIRGADVVGVGEATHGSSEFYTVKHRLFRHLVERQGFRSFVLEIQWSAGVRLDEWVRHGGGDLDTIMDEEFQAGGSLWNTTETRDLFRWIRAWNLRHPQSPVRVAGDGPEFAGPALFDTVTSYVARTRPDLLPEVRRLYRESRPTASMEETFNARLALPLADRTRMREDTRRVLSLLEHRPAGIPAKEHDLMLQHARAIAQNATLFGFDIANDAAAALTYRDQVMADNTAWWQRHTGTKVFLSAHNSHVAGESAAPESQPKTQGQFLRERLGTRYVNAGFTFGRGSFNAIDPTASGSTWRRVDVGPTREGSGENTLEKVSRRDWYLDTRTAAPGTARNWLTTAHPIRNIGASWPVDAYENTRLRSTYDIVIHLHNISASHRR